MNNHGDRKSPKDRVVGPLPNGRTLWLINGGPILTTYDTWDDPPSKGPTNPNATPPAGNMTLKVTGTQ